MRVGSAPVTIRLQEPAVLGDVPLAPRELTGVSPAELAQSLAQHLFAAEREARDLGSWRRAFFRYIPR